MTDKIDLYELLGVEKDDDIAVIKKAYKRLAMKYHPDRNIENPEAACIAFKPIAEAWAIINDPVKRAEYDLTGSHSVVGAIEAEGEALFLMMLIGAITQNGFREKDYIDQVRAMLAGSMRDAEAGITQLRTQANNITTLSEKFKPTKEGAHNPIEFSLREMAVEADARAEAGARELEVIDAAISVANQFKFVGNTHNAHDLIGQMQSFQFHNGNGGAPNGF